ncbi:MAG: ABC transporter substrate-binding protein [Fusobacteriaceae bacterium]
MKKFLIFFTVSLIALTGCKKSQDTVGKVIEPKIVKIGVGGKPKSLDPYMYNEIPGLFVSKQTFSTLLVNNNGEVTPELVESYKYLSELEIEFKLKKGIKFHNGEELKVSDVIYSFNRMKRKPASKIMVEDIKEIIDLGDNNFRIILTKPSAPLLFTLAHPLTSILSEKDTENKKDDISITPVGTGPFKFVSWGNGEDIKLESNNDYFKGKAKIDGLNFKAITEGSSRVAALETGEIDIGVGIVAIDNQIIEKNENLILISKPTTSTEYITLNLKNNEELKIKEVRQAINYAIDKQGIIDAIYLGKGIIADTIINPAVFGTYQLGKKYDFNPQKAKELLKSVGKETGLKFKIWVNDNVSRIQAAQIIQSNLREIGISLEIEVLEWSTYLQRTAQGEHDMFLGGWVSGTSDADIVLFPLLHSSSMGGAGNRAFYSNPQVDKYIEVGRTATTLEERKEAYKEAQIILSEELPLITLFYKNENIGLSKKIKNFVYNATTMHTLYGIEKLD